MATVVIKMHSFEGFPVDVMVTEDVENHVSPDKVMSVIREYQLAGFATPPKFVPFDKSEKKGFIGQLGSVHSVKPVTTKNNVAMFAVTAKLDDAGKEVTWNEFKAGTFRVNDRVKMTENDKGFIVGQLTDEPAPEGSFNFIPF